MYTHHQTLFHPQIEQKSSASSNIIQKSYVALFESINDDNKKNNKVDVTAKDLINLIKKIQTKYLAGNNQISTLQNTFYSTIIDLSYFFKCDITEQDSFTFFSENNKANYLMMNDMTKVLLNNTPSIKEDYCVVDFDLSHLTNKKLSAFLDNLVDAIKHKDEIQEYEFIH